MNFNLHHFGFCMQNEATAAPQYVVSLFFQNSGIGVDTMNMAATLKLRTTLTNSIDKGVGILEGNLLYTI